MKHVKAHISTQITDLRKKKLATNKKYILRRNELKIKILCKIAFWKMQK